MTNELLQEIRRMNKLLFLTLTRDLSQVEKIAFLAKAGLGQKDIADFVGTTAKTVSVALVRLKKVSKKK